MKAAYRILLADREMMFRAALTAAISEAGHQVVGDVANGASAVTEALRLRPEVVLAANDLRDLNGTEVCAAIKSQDPAVKVVVMSAAPQADVLLSAVQAGADGYVTKAMPLAGLLSAINRVGGGQSEIPPGMLGTLLHSLIARRRAADSAMELYAGMTRREREILELLVDGCDHHAIAEILVISPHTARTHIQNVISKLGVHSRLEAAAMAVEHGLIQRLAVRRS